MKQVAKLILIPILPLFISALTLIADQQSLNYQHSHDELLFTWYFIPSFINTSLGFVVNVTWPYVLSQWISTKYGLLLALFCFITDFIFRGVWFFNHSYFQNNLHKDHTFVSIWAAIDDINSFLTVPIIIYYIYHRNKSIQSQQNATKNDQEFKERNINMDYINLDEIESVEDVLTIDTSQSIYSQNGPKYEESLIDPHFRKISFMYILMVLWFTILNGFQWYNESMRYSAWYKLPPFVIIASMLLWELYLCETHKNIRFVHYSLICIFIQVQQLCLFDWGYLVIELHDWTVFGHFQDNIAKLIIFILYTFYFQFAAFMATKLCEHVSVDIECVSELNFIFIFYEETFLTVYLSKSVNINWTILVMITLKVCIRIIQFDHRILNKMPVINVKKETLARRYLYSLISTFVVFIGQSVLLIVDYLQHSYDDGWMLNVEKNPHNLFMGLLILFITFIGHCIAFAMIWYNSKENYGSNIISKIPIDTIYFVLVIAISQITSFNLDRFYPFKA